MLVDNEKQIMDDVMIVNYYNENGRLPIELISFEDWKRNNEMVGIQFENITQAYQMFQADVAIAKGYVEMSQQREQISLTRENNEIQKDGNTISYTHLEVEKNKALSMSEQATATTSMAKTAQNSLTLESATRTQRVWEEQRDVEGNVIFRGFVDKPYDEKFLDAVLGISMQEQQKEWNMEHCSCLLQTDNGQWISIEKSNNTDYLQGGFDYTRFDSKEQELEAILSGVYINHASNDFTRNVEVRGTEIRVDVPSYISEQDINSFVFHLQIDKGMTPREVAENFFAGNQSYQQQQDTLPNTNQQQQPKPKFKGMGMD